MLSLSISEVPEDHERADPFGVLREVMLWA